MENRLTIKILTRGRNSRVDLLEKIKETCNLRREAFFNDMSNLRDDKITKTYKKFIQITRKKLEAMVTPTVKAISKVSKKSANKQVKFDDVVVEDGVDVPNGDVAVFNGKSMEELGNRIDQMENGIHELSNLNVQVDNETDLNGVVESINTDEGKNNRDNTPINAEDGNQKIRLPTFNYNDNFNGSNLTRGHQIRDYNIDDGSVTNTDRFHDGRGVASDRHDIRGTSRDNGIESESSFGRRDAYNTRDNSDVHDKSVIVNINASDIERNRFHDDDKSDDGVGSTVSKIKCYCCYIPIKSFKKN